jgi:hypothetical protein
MQEINGFPNSLISDKLKSDLLKSDLSNLFHIPKYGDT